MNDDLEAERDENRIDGILDADATGMVRSQAMTIHEEIEEATDPQADEPGEEA